MTFDKDIAIQCAELIQAAYVTGMKPDIEDKRTDTQVIIRKFGDVTYVIFPGTASFRDTLTDLSTLKVKYNGGKAHAGFVHAYGSVSNAIREEIARRGNALGDVVVCGHSLGGALATLCALDLSTIGFISSVRVFTFGSPRVGNGSFTRSYDAALNDVTFRIVNADDPVPYLPPWLLGFRHVGREAFLNDEGGIEIERSLFSQLSATAAAAGKGYATQGASAFASISAHNIVNYLKKLRGIKA